MTVKSNTGLFHVLFLEDNGRQSVHVEETKEVDLAEIKRHLERGESVFITRKKRHKL